MTAAFDEDAVRNWLVDYLVTNIGCSPDQIESRRIDARSGSGVARRGGAHR